MSLSSQISVWDLWSESAKNSETVADPVFQECLEVALEGRIFETLTDDKIKLTLSTVNSLLNDPKSKSIGLTVFLNFVEQVNPARLVGFQDAIISSLHLVVKGLESPVAHSGLAKFLPNCHELSEVNQVVTTSIVPKILGYLTDESRLSASQRSHEELDLLKVCLLEYHGPCGNQREKLEKLFGPVMDSDHMEIVQMASEVLPLLSYAGGGGNGGERHIKDWNLMFTKCLKTAYSALLQLYADNWPSYDQENPFDGEVLSGLRKITEPQVLLRLSLLKRRLQNLLSILSGYLRFPFPAPKLVPVKGILKLISGLLSTMPLTKSRSSGDGVKTKEAVFLSALSPGVHLLAFNLMKTLFTCVGTNIFTEATTVEHLISSEFKWLQESPRAFESLKCGLYGTLLSWLNLTGGSVTNSKTLALWVNAIGLDSRVEKDVVELKILTKPKPGKSVKLSHSSPLSLTSSSTQVFVKKSHVLCTLAFQTLGKIMSSLDTQSYKKVYEHLLKTASIINQFQQPPSPYDSSKCKQLLYESLATMCFHPQAQSPISLALIINLIRKGMHDPTNVVNKHCGYLAAQLERLVHPVSAPLMLAGSSPQPIVLNNATPDSFLPENNEMETQEDSSDDDETVAQNDVNESNANRNTSAFNEERILAALKQKMEETLKDVISKSQYFNVNSGCSKYTKSSSVVKSNTTWKEVPQSTESPATLVPAETEVYDVSDTDDPPEIIAVNGNGNGIHSPNELESDDDISVMDEISMVDGKRKVDNTDNTTEIEVKKFKTTSPTKQPTVRGEGVEGPSLEEMLSSFIDVELSGPPSTTDL